MISRYYLKCPGCGEVFIARLGVEPTRGTRFYLPCPHCRLPIRGSMSGSELQNYKIHIECDILNGSDLEPTDAPVVTINPFVPSLYEADSFDPTGSFPTMTLLQLLGHEGFRKFESERHAALEAGQVLWPQVRILFQYYLQGNAPMFARIAKEQFGLDWEPSTAHQRASVAYHALGMATSWITGSAGSTRTKVIDRFSRKHTAAMNRSKEHLLAFRRRGQAAAGLERDLFAELNRFVEQHESWEMGLLGRFVEAEGKETLEGLVLYRDEFSTVRDLYQHGFELASKCLWPLVAAQNTVKQGSPDDFGETHPQSVPMNKRPKNLEMFDKLSNAYKIQYVTQVPGWQSFADLLKNRRRNTIGHATAHHDLQTGRVVSDEDPQGITYLEFLSETLGVFEALSTLAQVFRASRVASSPDFDLTEG